jgi:hypothetical protein
MSSADGSGGGGGGGAAGGGSGGGGSGASSSPRRGHAILAVEHDPHADRVKFAHESVVERQDALLEESQRNFDVFLQWLQRHSANFPDLCVVVVSCRPPKSNDEGEDYVGFVCGGYAVLPPSAGAGAAACLLIRILIVI